MAHVHEYRPNFSERTAADSLLSLGRSPEFALHPSSAKRAREANELDYIMPRKRYGFTPYVPSLYPHSRIGYYERIDLFRATTHDFATMSTRKVPIFPRPGAVSLSKSASPRQVLLRPVLFSTDSPTGETTSTERPVTISPSSVDAENFVCSQSHQDQSPKLSNEDLPKLVLSVPKHGVKRVKPVKLPKSTVLKEGGNGLDAVVPSKFDVLIGTGRTNSSHPGNRRFHKAIYERYQEYFDADYKKGIVDQAIAFVHDQGGRFLAKGKKTKWAVVDDMERLERNTRKSFHMAKKQRAKEVHIEEDQQRCEPLSKLPKHGDFPRFRKGVQVSVYRKAIQSYRLGIVEDQDKRHCLVRFEGSSSNSAEWVDVNMIDCRTLSRRTKAV